MLDFVVGQQFYQRVSSLQVLALGVLSRLAAELKISDLVPDPPKPPERNVQPTNKTREALSNNSGDIEAK